MMVEEPTEVPTLDPMTVADDEALAEAVDTVVRLDPVAMDRATAIHEHRAWLRCAVDADTWKLVIEIEARTNERWNELTLLLVRYGWEQGRRHPLSTAVTS